MAEPLLAVRFGAPDDQKRNWSAVGIESRLKGTIDRVGDELGDREFLVGSSLTLADISVAAALQIWTRGVGQHLPATLQAYCDRLQERPACRRAMEAHGQGRGQSCQPAWPTLWSVIRRHGPSGVPKLPSRDPCGTVKVISRVDYRRLHLTAIQAALKAFSTAAP
jgi:hypothetical protein